MNLNVFDNFSIFKFKFILLSFNFEEEENNTLVQLFVLERNFPRNLNN